ELRTAGAGAWAAGGTAGAAGAAGRACTGAGEGDGVSESGGTSVPTGVTLPRTAKPQSSRSATSSQNQPGWRMITTMMVWPFRVAAPTKLPSAFDVQPFFTPIMPW